ncbi:hypothetical protein [Goodfellowiella coeruleoviolacea]|uniref:Uncharacterized protein n=1 Tax=Goodfellowiella coeruleoviolacea TaxID=334858 RepID=A0AAE3GHC0_9PSEU|nr:hypothetical protein [Goodfellowiella coeruleoviolacea]MCP2168175.1 hypothetical protein [Goodfellowiella coeruleoviolacea]
MVEPDAWYYCLKHHKPERGAECRALDRMGPYPDEQTAARALDIAKERTKSADDQDRSWNDD